MKLDLDQPIVTLKGEPFPDDMTLGTVSFLAVTTGLVGDEGMAGNDKMRLYGIAAKVHAGGEVELSIEDLDALKERIGRMFSVEIVGCAWLLLETNTPKKAKP
jgi:hypothetical protein